MSDTAIFDAHCSALGKLCVAWAFVDRQLNDLVQAMLGCSEAAAACVGTIADGTAPRIKMARLLNHERPISDEWTAAFHKLLSEIESIGQARNRYIHDRWELSEGSMIRIDRRASARRPQSRQPLVLEFDTEHVATPGEVEELTTRTGKVAFALHVALRDQEDWRQEGMLAKPPLLIRAGDIQSVPDAIQLLGIGG